MQAKQEDPLHPRSRLERQPRATHAAPYPIRPMKRASLFLLSALSLFPSLRAAETYPTHPDSEVQPGVPVGELIRFIFDASRIFPGTTRQVTVYVPQQYDPARPACVYVNQDGVQWNAPVVFNNLIARGEMPVTIGIFVTPGAVRASNSETALDRFNRSLEYDGLGDDYARFLLEELLPEVERKTTSDGRPIRLSRSGNDRAIGGSSSGAIAAFTAAWERPDAFTRVFSAIGTYVGLRGGNEYPTRIRKVEPKPLRVFLQSGTNDNNLYAGDWWMANQTMERALTYAGYEVNHVWGEGGHSGAHGTAIFPDAMRWLWKDWPQAVQAAPLNTERLGGQVLVPGEDWQLVGKVHENASGTAAHATGSVSFTDRIGNPVAMAIGPKNQWYGADRDTATIYGSEPAGNRRTVVATGIAGNDLIAASNGNLYITTSDAEGSEIWLVRPDGSKQLVDSGDLLEASGITLSPDQTLLYVADRRSHWIYSHVIQPDGTLTHKQRYYWLHTGDGDDDAGTGGLRVDTNGNLYAATKMGIQICDQAGRVNAILPLPGGAVTHLVFGGPNFDTLYAVSGGQIYRRKLAVRGANAWDTPNKPPRPRL